MKRIWLVRHGESLAQIDEDDHRNPVLSERGKEQGRRLAERLDGIRFDLVVISPLERAWQTFELSKIKGTRVVFDSRLIETAWGGERYYEKILPISVPDFAEPDRHDAWRRDVAERVEELIEDILSGDGEQIALFGHWGVFRNVLLAFAGMDGAAMSVQAITDNASVSLLEVTDDGQRRIRYWNDRSHVADLLDEVDPRPAPQPSPSSPPRELG